MQALLVPSPPGMRQAILNGTLKAGIIQGYRDYTLGKIILCDHLEPWAVLADVTEVRHTTPQDITAEEYEAAGSKGNMIDWVHDMQKICDPTITENSPVTFIRWDNVSGALVEEVERIKALKTHYPQDCQCQDFEHGLVANDCHVHNENPRHFVGDENLDCDCHVWKNAKVTCDNCTNHAAWVRKTAFSGNHFFCEACAKAEKDFGQEDSSYFYWTTLE